MKYQQQRSVFKNLLMQILNIVQVKDLESRVLLSMVTQIHLPPVCVTPREVVARAKTIVTRMMLPPVQACVKLGRHKCHPVERHHH